MNTDDDVAVGNKADWGRAGLQLGLDIVVVLVRWFVGCYAEKLIKSSLFFRSF